MALLRLLPPLCLLLQLAGCAVADGAEQDTFVSVGSLPEVVSTGPAPAPARPLPALPLPPASAVAVAAPLESTPDLYALSLRLRVRADDGDVQAAWQLSQIHEYCAGHAADPARYAQVGAPGVPGMAAARARISRRCGGFVPADGLVREQVITQRRQAALEGSLAAEASLLGLGEPLSADPDYRRDLALRVLEAGDGEAMYALAPAMGLRASDDPAMAGLVAGSVEAELAWRLAACELGKDCGPGSMVMDSYCAHGGICSSHEGEHLIDLVQRTRPQQVAGRNQATLLMRQLLEARRLAWR